jgi:hypothetical protein
MSMMRFGLLFRELAARETRTASVFERSPLTGNLPVDEYGFDESYCTEPGCDCRRVIINVLARHAQAHVATINHAFERPAKGAVVDEQTFLDPLNRQSPLAPALLELFENVVLADPAYRQRLEAHYHLFKSVVDDPAHPAQRQLRAGSYGTSDERTTAARDWRRSLPPPLRRGRKKRK